MSVDDPHADLKQHRLTPEARRLAKSRAKPAGAARPFVRFPCLWKEELTKARHIASYRVALHLLHETWKTDRKTVELSNEALRTEGVSRRQKWRALEELTRLGLVAVERRPRKTPRVTVRFRS